MMPAEPPERQHALRHIGLALAACEKSVSIVYERNLRPKEKLHQPWIDRVSAQLLAAYQLLELDYMRRPHSLGSTSIDQAGISVAVAWHFTQQVLPDVVPATGFPALQAYSVAAEALAEFRAAPHGTGTYRSAD
jgi:hypothetical protein